MTKPYQATLDSIAASVPLLSDYDHAMVSEIGCPYISNARATMLRKALDAGADIIVFIDHDVSWRPQDLLKLVETEGDFVAGTYRFKKPEVEYMGQLLSDDSGRPIVRADGCVKAFCAPAGFIKITREAVRKMMRSYPELIYGDETRPHFDFFQHGAHKGVWFGEDYAACRRWIDAGGDIWTPPDLSIDHYTTDSVFAGNLHEFLMRQPGGSKANA
jgi:glycosyltransferase involved in cell wall biosynthesis